MSSELLTHRRHAQLPDRETPLSRRYLRVLESWIPTGLHYFEDWPLRPNCGHFLGGCHWYGNETIAGAFTFALAASSPAYDPQHGGCSRSELRQMALKGLRYLCFTHDTGPPECVRPATGLGRSENCGTKWGERGLGFFKESQCGTTIARMALTALLLGDEVDEETWDMLAAVHEDYAERFGDMVPRNGVYRDTQMEENAWTSCGLASVSLVMENSAQAADWARNARRWMFATATAPQDVLNRGLFAEGETVSQLSAPHLTTLPDYMAENHGVVHPSYTASSVNFTGTLAAIYGIMEVDLPPHALYNRQRVYDQLKPTVERHGAAHPVQGMDWPYLPTDPGVCLHAAASLVLRDPDGAHFERCALTTLEQRQAGNEGSMYDADLAATCHGIQDPLIMREATIASPAAAYLMHRLLGDGPRPTPTRQLERSLRGVTVCPHSGFAFHRHGRGQTSFAWRNCIMALPLTLDGLYTVGPASNSFLGSVTVRDRPDSQDLVSVNVDAREQGFAASLVMDRAQGTVRQEVLFASLPSGEVLSLERFTAQAAITVERLDQGFLRLINESFERMEGTCNGSLTLYSPEGAEDFAGYVSADPDSDLVRAYDHPAWVNVDDRLGIAFSGTGQTVYHNRHHFAPWWAVADDLVLSRTNGPWRARANESLGHLCALVVPGHRHSHMDELHYVQLSARARAAGLIAGGHLAAALFAPKRGRVTLSARRRALPRIPVFAGTALIRQQSVAYPLLLEAGQALLRPALCHLDAEGELEITASDTGQVIAHNTGTQRSSVSVDGAKAVRLAPGKTVVLG